MQKKNEERKQSKVEAKLKAKQEHEGRHKPGSTETRALEGKMGCLLKFSGDLDDQTCREDLHFLFSNHGEIKWVDFARGAKEGIILFKEKAKEALEKARNANNGNLLLRNKKVTWKVLEGHAEKEALKKITDDQQESLNKWKSKGGHAGGRFKGSHVFTAARRFKGKGKGNRPGYAGAPKGRGQFHGRRTRFDDDDRRRGPMKRGRDGRDREEPASKHKKRENGARDK